MHCDQVPDSVATWLAFVDLDRNPSISAATGIIDRVTSQFMSQSPDRQPRRHATRRLLTAAFVVRPTSASCFPRQRRQLAALRANRRAGRSGDTGTLSLRCTKDLKVRCLQPSETSWRWPTASLITTNFPASPAWSCSFALSSSMP